MQKLGLLCLCCNLKFKKNNRKLLCKRFIFSYTYLRRITHLSAFIINSIVLTPFSYEPNVCSGDFFTGLARSYPAWRLILASSRDLTFVCQWNNVPFHISPPWTHFSFYYYCIKLCYICVHDAYLTRRPSSFYYIIRCTSTNKKDVKIRGCVCFYLNLVIFHFI